MFFCYLVLFFLFLFDVGGPGGGFGAPGGGFNDNRRGGKATTATTSKKPPPGAPKPPPGPPKTVKSKHNRKYVIPCFVIKLLRLIQITITSKI